MILNMDDLFYVLDKYTMQDTSTLFNHRCIEDFCQSNPTLFSYVFYIFKLYILESRCLDIEACLDGYYSHAITLPVEIICELEERIRKYNVYRRYYNKIVGVRI